MRDQSTVGLLARWRDAGDEAALQEFLRRYANRMIALVRQRMPGKCRRRFDPEDVVQSACRSFCMRIRDGRLAVEAGQNLWALLAQIAMCKLINQVDFHRAAKRSVDREKSPLPCQAGELWNVSFTDPQPHPEDVLALEEEHERILREFLPLHRMMVYLRLQNYSIKEISQKTKRTTRTVGDVMNRFGKRLGQRVEELSA
jgi:DNA-directed RNA polymerase specialized sigma24 family protein